MNDEKPACALRNTSEPDGVGEYKRMLRTHATLARCNA